ncbi:depupylase/deamidase Dop [Arthrobacter sp. H14]|uniref:depupylase/deamidase Dop n=1 Tax=Arthrobacter sp. H14 TaxID=1312959 RepID=UPI0004AC7C75|nr:depupylase/deamidase Dop [Arthrobacter sp. H14]
MTVRRVMGTETEYGILAPALPGANSTVLSTQIINSYASLRNASEGRLSGTRWDYSDEAPLTDARGWELSREDADPSQLTDGGDVLGAEGVALAGGRLSENGLYTDGPLSTGVLMNMVLSNGARLYVDHAHPEYSSPEVTNPKDAVIWDKAGDAVVLAALRKVARTPGLAAINLYKNNTDNKSVSYGSHENYLMPREVPFNRITAGLIPFFVSRQVICGAGRVGRGQDGSKPGFQISQRADFFEAEVGLETTIRRPIINTRDEPHATADKYRRLHVIIGDANLSEVSTYLKLGTASLVLDLIEHGAAPVLELVQPVQALQAISHDPSLRRTVQLKDGRSLTGLELQRIYYDAAEKHCWRDGEPDADTVEILARWGGLLDVLEDDPMKAAAQVDWVAKLKLLESYRQRDSLEWNDARLGLIDLQYADVRPEKGLYHRLAARGQMERLVTDEQIAAAVSEPPHDTRAYFRGKCIDHFGREVVGASWDSVIFELPNHRRLQRIPTREPLRGTRELTGRLFDTSATAEEFIDQLLGTEPWGVAR